MEEKHARTGLSYTTYSKTAMCKPWHFNTVPNQGVQTFGKSWLTGIRYSGVPGWPGHLETRSDILPGATEKIDQARALETSKHLRVLNVEMPYSSRIPYTLMCDAHKRNPYKIQETAMERLVWEDPHVVPHTRGSYLPFSYHQIIHKEQSMHKNTVHHTHHSGKYKTQSQAVSNPRLSARPTRQSQRMKLFHSSDFEHAWIVNGTWTLESVSYRLHLVFVGRWPLPFVSHLRGGTVTMYVS